MATVYEFKIAKLAGDEVDRLLEQEQDAPMTPSGEHKTLYAITETEAEAIERVETYVAATSYADIENNKVI